MEHHNNKRQRNLTSYVMERFPLSPLFVGLLFLYYQLLSWSAKHVNKTQLLLFFVHLTVKISLQLCTVQEVQTLSMVQ